MFIAQIIPLMLIRKQTALCIAQIVRLKLIRKQTAMCIAQIVPLMSIRKQTEKSSIHRQQRQTIQSRNILTYICNFCSK